MLDNGHPLNPDFELVTYSQGTVRHRFYPPDLASNKEMTVAEKARLYVIGQAAAFLSATEAMSKTDHAKYKEAQAQRTAVAKDVLDSISGDVPEAGALLASPSQESGRALAAALAGKDLTAAISSRLPSSYK